MTELDNLLEIIRSHRNSAKSVQMEKYMKGRCVYLGVQKPILDSLSKEYVKSLKGLSGDELIAICYHLWEQEEREFVYVAIEILKKYSKQLEEKHLNDIKNLITTNSWWDTVDMLAARPLGVVILANIHLVEIMKEWIESDDMWLRRSALLFQLNYKEKTDEKLLFEFCLKLAHEKEFFIRKAIGWVLRQYGNTNPESVLAFVKENEDKLSPLSKKEAIRKII